MTVEQLENLLSEYPPETEVLVSYETYEIRGIDKLDSAAGTVYIVAYDP